MTFHHRSSALMMIHCPQRLRGPAQLSHHLIDIAPGPALSRLDGAHHGMAAGMEMFGSVLVLGRIAASHMATLHAQAQMDPGVAYLHAVFTDMRVALGNFDLI